MLSSLHTPEWEGDPVEESASASAALSFNEKHTASEEHKRARRMAAVQASLSDARSAFEVQQAALQATADAAAAQRASEAAEAAAAIEAAHLAAAECKRREVEAQSAEFAARADLDAARAAFDAHQAALLASLTGMGNGAGVALLGEVRSLVGRFPSTVRPITPAHAASHRPRLAGREVAGGWK